MYNKNIGHRTAVIDEGAIIGKDTKIWHFSHICSGAKIGSNCVLGQNTMVSDGVIIGNNVKVQNNVSIYSGVIIEDDVFLGPSCVFTNISNPRSQINRRNLYEKTIVKRGATIGANSTIIPGVEIGKYAFISAGAVVTKDVPNYGLIKGVPGKKVGWMSRHGHKLDCKYDVMTCPESGLNYQLEHGELKCLDHNEDVKLSENLIKAKKTYREYKKG